MSLRRARRGLAVIALALIAPAGRFARAEVIVDDSVSSATPDEAAVELSWCASMPGCTAIWEPGSPAVVILDYAPLGVGESGRPPSDFDQSPSQPSVVSPDVDESVPDLDSP